jgi:glyoxylase I family protein
VDNELINQIRDLEMELLHSDTRKSAQRLNDLLADDFFEIGGPETRYTKDDVIRLLSEAPADRLAARDFQAAEMAPDTLLTTFTAEKESPARDELIVSVRSSIWQKRNGRWQIIFHQGTVSGRN